MRLFVLVRHGQSELNAAQRVNGDPSVPVPLTAQGRDEAAARPSARRPRARPLRPHAVRADAGDGGDRPRGRHVPVLVERLLDDIDVGDLEGRTIDDYRTWKRAHTRADAFPGGESLDSAALRYADAYASLLARPERRISSSATRSRSATRSTPPPARTSSTGLRTRSATASPTSSTRTGWLERWRGSGHSRAEVRPAPARSPSPALSRRRSARSACRRTSPGDDEVEDETEPAVDRRLPGQALAACTA